jgi:hypothetical protein
MPQSWSRVEAVHRIEVETNWSPGGNPVTNSNQRKESCVVSGNEIPADGFEVYRYLECHPALESHPEGYRALVAFRFRRVAFADAVRAIADGYMHVLHAASDRVIPPVKPWEWSTSDKIAKDGLPMEEQKRARELIIRTLQLNKHAGGKKRFRVN